ncbi:MAG: hypothetical protein U1E65_34360 [Myxococcota bacterium]
MRFDRRTLLKSALSATQLGLLSRFGIREASAATTPVDAPTKLVTLYVPGGVRFWDQWWPMGDTEVDTGMLAPGNYSGEPVFFRASDLIELAPPNGNYPALRTAQSWDPSNVATRDFMRYTPHGYGWLQWRLWEQTSVIHGVDQGTNAHQSGYIAAMCGVAGADYRAPAVQSVVANKLYQQFRDQRPLPCVAIDARGMPVAKGLPPTAAPILVPGISSIAQTLSDSPMKNPWWTGLNARDADGITPLERRTITRARALQGRSTAATDAMLEQLAGGLESVSRVLSRDVTTVLSNTQGTIPITGVPYLANVFGGDKFGYGLGLANYHMQELDVPLDMTLRLLRSDLASVIHVYLAPYFDTHNGSYGHGFGYAHTKGVMDCIARFCGQLKDAPLPGKPGKTLLDDTLVVVFSEFARSWATGPSQSQPNNWALPDDHHPYTSVTLIGGGVAANRMVGSYHLPEGRGVEVNILEEDGSMSNRVPRAADVTTTVCKIMGLGTSDFFIPGGFGEVIGIRRDA